MESVNKRYMQIREIISRWNPPTTSHENLKKFALEQIDKSVYSEDAFRWAERRIKYSNNVRSQEEWSNLLNEYIEAAKKDVQRAKKHYDDEVETARQNTTYMKTLIESISDIDIGSVDESSSK